MRPLTPGSRFGGLPAPARRRLDRRQFVRGLGAGGLLLASGCHWPWMQPNPPPPPPPPAVGKAELPTAGSLVDWLNGQAEPIKGLQADLDIQVKEGNQAPVGISAFVAAQQPRNFRLKAKFLGNAGADFGSNDEEFWYWISKADPPYLYHCSYSDLPKIKKLPFPFQPEMVLTALGMAQYDRNKKYDVRRNGNTIELIETAESPQGERVFKTTVFNATQAGPGQPQVLAHVLQDKDGKVLARANIEAVQVDKVKGVTVPARIKFIWPDAGPKHERLEMTMRFYSVQVAAFDPQTQARLFSRKEVRAQTIDLAQYLTSPNGAAQGTGLQRTSGVR